MTIEQKLIALTQLQGEGISLEQQQDGRFRLSLPNVVRKLSGVPLCRIHFGNTSEEVINNAWNWLHADNADIAVHRFKRWDGNSWQNTLEKH